MINDVRKLMNLKLSRWGNENLLPKKMKKKNTSGQKTESLKKKNRYNSANLSN